ncbi:hypothetical protein PG999_010529 [Apiospora kogelbergensis]|uniref:2EXR domain-containing protein n=1 Tax=Apiospora kogelbergensis TaxID=1337665 RepID=A0AAW0QAD8_9PEZI
MGDGLSQTPSEFHLFPRLPPEVRHRIWNMSVKPQEIEMPKWLRLRRHFFKQPALLQACPESRGYLASYGGYVKSFWSTAQGYGGAYRWVNFDVDMVCLPLYTQLYNFRDSNLVQNLVMREEEQLRPLFKDCGRRLRTMPALRNVDCTPPEALEIEWWIDWAHLFESLYGAEAEPVTFRLRIFRPRRIVKEEAGSERVVLAELNPDNYLELCRATGFEPSRHMATLQMHTLLTWCSLNTVTSSSHFHGKE